MPHEWTILMAEDEELLREMYSQLLRGEGYTVLEATNGAEALDIMHSRGGATPVDLLITDINMPEMNGITLSDIVGKEFPGTGILVLTGVGTKPTVVKLMQLGVCDYLDKPASPSEFLDKVNGLLENRQRPGVIAQLHKLHKELHDLVETEVEQRQRQILRWLRGGINHRFNQPLSVLTANLEMLERIHQRSEMSAAMKDMASASISDMREAVACLLDLVHMLAEIHDIQLEKYVGENSIIDLKKSSGH